MKGSWKDFLGKYWPPDRSALLILVLVGLLLAVIAIPSEPEEEEEAEASGIVQVPESTYEEELARQFEELLSSVDGVGRVRVMLTFSDSGEKLVEKDRSVSGETSQEETVYEEDGGSVRTPYVTSETNPEVSGVLVIAEGGGTARVRQEILEAAEALFGVEAHKIKIMKMEGTQ